MVQEGKNRLAAVVTNRAQFDAINIENTDYLFGSFEPERMLEETERRKDNSEPSVSEMTEMAIKILQKNPNGFYLFVEGEEMMHCDQVTE